MYGNADDFKTYHQDRGRSIPAGWTDSVIEAALLVASEWLDSSYEKVWIGTPTGGFTQENLWPRTDAITNTNPTYTFPDDAIPERVINATYEAAFRQATSPGALSVDFTPSKFAEVRVEGAISVKYRNDFTSPSDIQTQIGIIQNLMSPLINPDATGSFSSLSGSTERVR
jgi:hypothetical protein